MDLDEESSSYCSPKLENLRFSYLKFHFTVLVTACVVGAVGNLLTVVVLTRKRLRSPVNLTLAAVAIAHLVFSVETLCITVGDVPQLQNTSFLLSVLYLFHINFGTVLYFVASCLVVVALLWNISDANKPHNSKHATIVIAIAFLVSLCLHIPLFISFQVSQGYQGLNEEGNLVIYFDNDINLSNQNVTLVYQWTFSDIATNNEHLLIQANEWIYGVVFAIVPCLISFILIFLNVVRNRSKDQRLERNNTGSIEMRTLLVISMLSVITDLLVAIVNLLKSLLGQEFVMSCILPLNEVIEVLIVIFPVVTVFVYCKTSKLYWSTLVAIFKPNFLTRWWP